MGGADPGGEAHTVFVYDASCPLCRRAADWAARHAVPGRLELLPCDSPERAERFPGIREEDCMRQAFAVRPGGRVVEGPDAVAEVLLLVPRWRWVARALRLPVLRRLTPLFYRWFARRRHALSALMPGSRAEGRDRGREKE